ncbi:MAG: hypothetical protein AAFN30_16765 [Actinomycetota bacterium]
MIEIPSAVKRPEIKPPEPTTIVVIVAVILVGLVALVFARRAIEPLDRLLTEQVCASAGDEVARPVEEVEPSNRFALVNRSQGWCRFGPVDPDLEAELAEELADDEVVELSAGAQLLAVSDPAAEVQLALPDLQLGDLYRAGKWMGVLLQLGAASVAIRLVADPLFDRFIRPRR